MTRNGALNRLADLVGIEPVYADIWGKRHRTTTDSKRALLTALGRPAASEEEAKARIAEMEDGRWRRTLPAVLVVPSGERIAVPVHLPVAADGRPLDLELLEESGATHRLRARFAETAGSETRRVGGERRVRRLIEVPAAPPPGYHVLRLAGTRGEDMRLIVAPPRCYLPDAAGGGEKGWGLSVNVYALRSPRNWGMGDFTDLADVIGAAARLGASAVGVNPLHALFRGDPERASPYSPSSRLFVNPLYVDVERVAEYAECAEARQAVAAMADRLEALRAATYVDYIAVSEIKHRVFGDLHRCFRRLRATGREAGRARADAFDRFLKDGGERLRRFALFEALSERFEGVPWTEWPETHRSPDTADVAAFAEEHAERIEYHAYLQWLADEQLTALRAAADGAGLAIGLYCDLAVGVDPAGADAWSEQDVVVGGAGVGCPPDPFNMLGQHWGLRPLSPQALRDWAYEPFIAMVRANMCHAGALRIDHAMGLMHLYWIPDDLPASAGAYLSYPFEDLLGIVALESHRNRCVVIGEDLGTVPEGFRERMSVANVLSYRVLYFEKDGDRFKAPDEYPELALACVTTHDLATLAGFWTGADILLRKRLGLYPSPSVEQSEWEARQHDRTMLMDALARERLLPAAPLRSGQPAGPLPPSLVGAVHAYLARSPARLVMVQLDDIAEETDQINLPGTVDEYPNWRRRLSLDLDGLLASPVMEAVRAAMAGRRGRGTPQRP